MQMTQEVLLYIKSLDKYAYKLEQFKVYVFLDRMKTVNNQKASDSPFRSLWSKVFNFNLLDEFIPIYFFLVKLILIDTVNILNILFSLRVLSRLKNKIGFF